nr:hypothetical protein CFP56_54918 [Quercus suber]
MLIPSKSWLLLACITNIVVATKITSCYTLYGTSSQHSVSTKLRIHYTQCTSTKTVTNTLSTHLPGGTITTTSMVTSTGTATTTVASSSGFLPIESTYPSRTPYDGAYDHLDPSKRDAEPQLVARGNQLGNSSTENLHEQFVGCNIWTHNKCVTKTKTVTSTLVLSATAALVTVTTTTTTTTTVATNTVLAECLNSNQAYLQGLQKVSGPADAQQNVILDATSPYECCAAAMSLEALTGTDAMSNVFAISVPPSEMQGVCFIVYSPGITSCPSNRVGGDYKENQFNSPQVRYVGGNGACGEIVGHI